MDERWVFLGAAISLIGCVAYARRTSIGTIQPNRMTFFLWSVAPILAFVVQLRLGVGLVSLMTLTMGVGPLIILIASYTGPKSSWRLSRFDYACGALSGLGLVVWLLLQQGVLAILLFVAADGIAALPTVRKAWIAPKSESVGLYAAAFINAAIAIGTIDRFSLEAAAFPVYALALTAVLIVFIRLRPKMLGGPAYSC